MAGPGETFGIPWPSLAIRLWLGPHGHSASLRSSLVFLVVALTVFFCELRGSALRYDIFEKNGREISHLTEWHGEQGQMGHWSLLGSAILQLYTLSVTTYRQNF
jgi:hypothetical protein